MIVAASTTLLADSRAGELAGCCPGRSSWWAGGEPGRQRRGGQPTAAGRVIAA